MLRSKRAYKKIQKMLGVAAMGGYIQSNIFNLLWHIGGKLDDAVEGRPEPGCFGLPLCPDIPSVFGAGCMEALQCGSLEAWEYENLQSMYF